MRNEHPNRNRRKRRTFGCREAFSLLEVILALALSGLIVAAIAMAIHLHLVMLEQQQTTIEQTHIARNTLDILAVDIRAAMQYKPFDVETVDIEEAAEGSSTAAAAAAASGVDPTAGGVDPTMGQEEQPPANQNIQSSVVPMPHPGFYGNNTELMFNISRLPRMDQFNPYIAAGDKAVSIPSDIKTTSFFLDRTGTLGGDPLNEQPMGGLYRRQIAHAVAAYANDNGYTLNSDATTQLLATEVVDLSFRYFNGDDWQDAWDSDEEGGFPRAVEVTIIVDPRRKEGVKDLPEYTGYDEEFMSIHRRVVHLPVAEILSEEELQAIEDSQQSVADSAQDDQDNGGGGP